MLPANWNEEARKFVLQAQIVAAALLLGSATFAIVAFVLRLNNQVQVNQGFLITVVATGVAVAVLMASFVVPAIVARAGRKRIAAGRFKLPSPDRSGGGEGMNRLIDATGDAGRLLVLYQACMILTFALPEGGVFIALISTIVEGSWIGFVVAGVLMLSMLARFPTFDRASNWVERHLQALEDDRQFSA